MPIPITYTIAQNQQRAMNQAKAMAEAENHGATTLAPGDERESPKYVIYIYNILAREYVVNQPPLFPALKIPACEKGEQFSFTIIPAFVNEPYNKPGTTEMYYKKIDGRRCATSLLNPSAFPGLNWESQLQNWDSIDQSGNNLNKFGVFWSLTRPDEKEKLREEIKLFRARVQETMNELVKEAELFAAQRDLKSIGPLHHFAMDYFGKEAGWHMTSVHMVSCPMCGEAVKEGIAYHKNSMGEKCIIDIDKYKEMVRKQREVDRELAAETGDEDELKQPGPPPKRRKTA